MADGDLPLWHICYDDGDAEDMDQDELAAALELAKNPTAREPTPEMPPRPAAAVKEEEGKQQQGEGEGKAAGDTADTLAADVTTQPVVEKAAD